MTNHYVVNRLVDHARLASVYETQVVQLQHRLSQIEDNQLQSFQDQVRVSGPHCSACILTASFLIYHRLFTAVRMSVLEEQFFFMFRYS